MVRARLRRDKCFVEDAAEVEAPMMIALHRTTTRLKIHRTLPMLICQRLDRHSARHCNSDALSSGFQTVLHLLLMHCMLLARLASHGMRERLSSFEGRLQVFPRRSLTH